MKKVFYVVAASLLMTSCLEDKMIEEYNEDFVSVFGNADPLHTWKMVDSKSVEVSLDKSSRVKIYVLVDNTYRLAADYENVSGTRTLSFDAPAGCEDIYVTVDGVPYQGGGSRSEVQKVVSPVTKTEDFKGFTYKQITDFHNDGESLPEKMDNTGRVTSTGCRIISNGQLYKFYPIYWGGIFYHSYGLYYYDKNTRQRHEFDFYDHKVTDCLQQLTITENGDKVWQNVTADYAYDYFFAKSESKPIFNDSEVVLMSRCYTINLPAGTEFGFYVDIIHKLDNGTEGNRGRFYSDPELNKAGQMNKPFSAFANYHITGDNQTSYITVEDFDDNDYNDFIFMLEGEHTHVIESPIKYIYAIEDLGGANDFDFNDVVFSVSHVKGKENATVQPLAAGGIYPANICFNGKSYGKEIHDMFGVKTNVMVNTASGTTKGSMKKADPFLVPVGANWSNTATSYGNSGNGFSVKVTIPGKTGDKVVEVSTSKPGGKDSAPQMLVLSGDWLWPTEKTSIAVAYPEFADWVQNFVEGNDSWDDEPAGPVVNWK